MELEYIDITGPDDVAKLRPFWDEVLRRLEARTHGCGCCAEYITPTLADMEEYIEGLESELKQARELFERFFVNKKDTENA